MAADRSARAREAEGLEEGRRAALEGWSYDRSTVRPGSRAALIWREYPLASVWLVAVSGLHDSEHGVAVFCGRMPMALCTERRTVADALEFAAQHLECAARDSDREHPDLRELLPEHPDPTTTRAWREHTGHPLERSRRPEVRALSIGPAARR